MYLAGCQAVSMPALNFVRKVNICVLRGQSRAWGTLSQSVTVNKIHLLHITHLLFSSLSSNWFSLTKSVSALQLLWAMGATPHRRSLSHPTLGPSTSDIPSSSQMCLGNSASEKYTFRPFTNTYATQNSSWMELYETCSYNDICSLLGFP